MDESVLCYFCTKKVLKISGTNTVMRWCAIMVKDERVVQPKSDGGVFWTREPSFDSPMRNNTLSDFPYSYIPVLSPAKLVVLGLTFFICILIENHLRFALYFVGGSKDILCCKWLIFVTAALCKHEDRLHEIFGLKSQIIEKDFFKVLGQCSDSCPGKCIAHYIDFVLQIVCEYFQMYTQC